MRRPGGRVEMVRDSTALAGGIGVCLFLMALLWRGPGIHRGSPGWAQVGFGILFGIGVIGALLLGACVIYYLAEGRKDPWFEEWDA